ncbi:DUF5610 domain-containing protein [Pseudoalteromonas aurantia]|uniref:DUF5610 domain-containing protein n=1 Tax=Pseudoalteromonas aurantia 208 TaxID=1314867 RepID=A0ABR9EFK1_9GAMM|nr:DUF5610 domain-containing protein [Pseudoalteromonas aurantia]MBE0369778.1 hypothetical protein [Pseudoalteromonas aurantia 208]
MKIGQLNQLLNPASSFRAGNSKPFMPTIQNNADSYSGDKSKLAAKFLDDKLAEALGIEKKPEKEKPLFDFESIVKNVLDFVKGAVNKAKADGKDDDELRNMLGEARKGVLMGIDEATDELKESSIFNDEIGEGIAKSKEGIFNGLDEFEKSLFEPQPDKMSVSAAQYASLANQADYTFTTAEGDEVQITFSDAYSQSQGASYAKEGNREGFAYAEKNRQEVSFSISVNGDLNEDEQKAINEMMKDIRDVSDSFFGGDYDEAFDKAKELNIGSDQIANFTMDLRQTKTTAAISQYQQSNPLKDLEKALQPLDKQLETINETAKSFGLESQLPDILEWMNHGQDRLNNFLDYAEGFFTQLNRPQER